MGKTLNIVERAYHATLEEQDDVGLWIVLAVKVMGGADVDVLLRGTAVNYLLKTQNASGLEIAGVKIDPPPKIAEDIQLMQSKSIRFFAVEEDITKRAINKNNLIPGVELIKKSQIAKLFNEYERVFHW